MMIPMITVSVLGPMTGRSSLSGYWNAMCNSTAFLLIYCTVYLQHNALLKNAISGLGNASWAETYDHNGNIVPCMRNALLDDPLRSDLRPVRILSVQQKNPAETLVNSQRPRRSTAKVYLLVDNTITSSGSESKTPSDPMTANTGGPFSTNFRGRIRDWTWGSGMVAPGQLSRTSVSPMPLDGAKMPRMRPSLMNPPQARILAASAASVAT